MLAQSLLALATAGLASAHYTLVYPEWRGDSFDDEAGYTQWDRPCAGVPYGSGNRTDWPLDGGSLNVTLGHAFNFLYVNLGLEEDGNVTTFNYTLTPQPFNTTGSGHLCLRRLPILDDIPDGTNASLQIVKVGASGNAQYNCADIYLTSDAEPLSEDECSSEDAEWYVLEDQEEHENADGHSHSHGDSDESGEDNADDEDGDSAAVSRYASVGAVVSVGMAVAFGLSL